MAEPRLIAGSRTPAADAAEILASAVRDADRARGHARLAIAGGSAVAVVSELRTLAAPDAWGRLRLTWVDERCVPLAHADSNRGAAHRDGGLAAQPVGHELPLWLDDDTPERALARIRGELTVRFADGLDATLLGMGPDGHVASLFPGRPAPRGDRAAFVPDSPKPPPERITLTRGLLATAPRCVLYAVGESKRPMLERLLAGDPALPATGLPGLIIVTDVAL